MTTTATADSAAGMAATDRPVWPARPLLLAVLGAVAGMIAWALSEGADWLGDSSTRASVALFVAMFAGLLAFTAERHKLGWSVAFALTGALVIAAIRWSSWTTRHVGYDADTGAAWQFGCAVLAVAIAAPLFQTARDVAGAGGGGTGGRGLVARFPYPDVHAHAWTNVVLFMASWAFAGLAVLLGNLIAQLFRLIGIRALETLMDSDWFVAVLVGAALGGAVGLLRERDRIVRTMLSVVLVVLRVLAPVLAVFLAAFLLLLPFTGLSTLWEATRSTTPVVLGSMIVALVLANAVFGQDDGDASHSRLMRLAARVLSVTLLPLAVIGAVSMGLRIAQHGLSVERLWGLTLVALATAYGLGYLVSIVAGWRGG